MIDWQLCTPRLFVCRWLQYARLKAMQERKESIFVTTYLRKWIDGTVVIMRTTIVVRSALIVSVQQDARSRQKSRWIAIDIFSQVSYERNWHTVEVLPNELQSSLRCFLACKDTTVHLIYSNSEPEAVSRYYFVVPALSWKLASTCHSKKRITITSSLAWVNESVRVQNKNWDAQKSNSSLSWAINISPQIPVIPLVLRWIRNKILVEYSALRICLVKKGRIQGY